MAVTPSNFASGLRVETAFSVLAVAKQLKSAGKDVIELEIGDSPFPSTAAAKRAGIEAIEQNHTHYCASVGLPEMRSAVVEAMAREYGVSIGPENVVIGPGAKIFETLFCLAFLDPGDGVLVFGPHFPTYLPNIAARGARAWVVDLKEERHFRPDPAQVAQFLRDDARPKAVFLNSPHNPTGGVATEDDLREIAKVVRGRNCLVFSDEPYNHMVWRGRHCTLLQQEGMLPHCVAAYTFSKSYSMSGWRLGYAVSSPENAAMMAKMVNVTLSCVPPMVQLAGAAALKHDSAERDRQMAEFGEKVRILAAGLNRIEGIHCLEPAGAFYAFPNVKTVCNQLRITSHGLAMYLLEGADHKLGVACLGGESFGSAGEGFLRLSCAEPNDRLQQALDFLPVAFSRRDRVEQFLAQRPEWRLEKPYE